MTSARPLIADTIAAQSNVAYPAPFKSRMGEAAWRQLGDAFGLKQFGVNLETMAPGAQSALRHWHDLSDEFVYMLEGELVLRHNDGETAMTPGMCIGFPAGNRNGHHLVNRSTGPARFLVVGSRIPGDMAFYPDDDLMWCRSEAGRYPAHKDGTAY